MASHSALRTVLARSLFERLHEKEHPFALVLREQYRMAPYLSRYLAETFYEEHTAPVDAPTVAPRFASASFVDDFPWPRRGDRMAYVEVMGSAVRKGRGSDPDSLFNAEEAAAVVFIARFFISRGLSPDRIAIITPYAAQKEEISVQGTGIVVDTVYGFQVCSILQYLSVVQLGLIARFSFVSCICLFIGR